VLVLWVLGVTQGTGQPLGADLGVFLILSTGLHPGLVGVFVGQLALLGAVMLEDTRRRHLTALLGGGAQDFAVEPSRSRTQPDPAIEIRVRKRAGVARTKRLGEVESWRSCWRIAVYRRATRAHQPWESH
jgi:hypothetical protein